MIRLRELTRFQRDGAVEVSRFDRNFTVIKGPRNSGKTTLLKIIDYCFGAPGTAADEVGAPVVDAHLGFHLGIRLDEEEHRVERSVERTWAPLTKVMVDGRPLDLDEYGRWLLAQLNWPRLQIPKGRVARSARELTALSFRVLLRHLYRREDSWQEFAKGEEEFHRQAVIAFFLGLARTRYSGEEFRVGEAERRVEAVEAALREATTFAEDTVAAIGTRLGLSNMTLGNLTETEAELRNGLESLESFRQDVTRQVQEVDEYQPQLGALLTELSLQLEKERRQETDLIDTQRGYEEAERSISAELARLERADVALGMFDEVPVRVCPACEQSVDEKRATAEPGVCFLCSQQVVPDARHRRIEAERVALNEELAELREVRARTQVELVSLRDRLEMVEAQRTEVANRINNERAAVLAPFMAELEELSASIGGIEQRLAAVSGLFSVLERVQQLHAEREVAIRILDEAVAATQRVKVSRSEEANRCAAMANRMNSFLGALESDPWRQGQVTLAAEDFSFYVGTKPWNQVLGGESKVLFFFAYQYALLHLALDLGDRAYGPGFVILDNPIQQGLPDELIREVLDLFNDAARRLDVQVITTVGRPVTPTGPYETVELHTQFGKSNGGSSSA